VSEDGTTAKFFMPRMR